MRGILPEELCGPFHDLEFLFELVDTFPRASELHTLRGTDAGDLTAVDAVLPHPPVKTSCADAEVFSNVLDRLTRTNKRDCTLPEFSGVLLGHKNEPFRSEMNSILTNGKGNQTVGQVTRVNQTDIRPIWFSEINEPVARVFSHHWPDAPNLGDITTIEWSTVPPVDILCGGFPCQDVSTVGKMAGLKPGTRSGLWAHMATAIDALQPDWVVIENVRGLLSAPRAPRKPRRR